MATRLDTADEAMIEQMVATYRKFLLSKNLTHRGKLKRDLDIMQDKWSKHLGNKFKQTRKERYKND